ncbi:MAG: hypothetical protein ACR2GT_00035 [Gaiellaceae bacterium]
MNTLDTSSLDADPLRRFRASELAADPRAALLAFWQPLGPQVRIERPVEPS